MHDQPYSSSDSCDRDPLSPARQRKVDSMLRWQQGLTFRDVKPAHQSVWYQKNCTRAVASAIQAEKTTFNRWDGHLLGPNSTRWSSSYHYMTSHNRTENQRTISPRPSFTPPPLHLCLPRPNSWHLVYFDDRAASWHPALWKSWQTKMTDTPTEPPPLCLTLSFEAMPPPQISRLTHRAHPTTSFPPMTRFFVAWCRSPRRAR